MGANNVLPSVPTFTAGAPTIAQLNALSYAVSFLVNHDVRPAFTAFMSSGTMSVPASTWTTVTYDHVAFDSDGVFGVAGAGLPSATIVTQGFYVFEACIPIQVNTNQDIYTGRFNFTAGANNPHLALNATAAFGLRGSKLATSASAAADNAVCLSAWFTTCCYPGDRIVPQVYTRANIHTVDKNNNASYIQGRFVPRFSGRLLATGT